VVILDNIKYIIDNAILFSILKKEYFHIYGSIRTDFPKYKNGYVFATFSVLNLIINNILKKMII
jgi:hypothetical protein